MGVAIERGYLDVAKAILSSGKVPKDSLGPALSAARQQGRSEIAELLVQAGAVPLPSASATVPPETLATYVGTYHNEGGLELAVSLDAESEHHGFAAAAYRDCSGLGRNLTIEVLEFLDEAGYTRRAGNLRRARRVSMEEKRPRWDARTSNPARDV